MVGLSAATAKEAIRRALGRPAYVPPEEAAYRRLLGKGFRPCAIVDVGAYHGDWTRLARRVFGRVPALMVEAQRSKAPMLDRVRRDLADVEYVSAALSDRSGEELTFYEMETGSSLLPERSDVPRKAVPITTRTLDEVAQGMPGPLFLKLDVQGAELKVLAGGGVTLDRAELVQLEIAVQDYNQGAPTMLDVLAFMDRRGFAAYDLAGHSRPDGVHLVQVDLLFTRKDSPLRPASFAF